jgi:GalNAc-alpha-(1->4)-GalNAc-alpha-(1->3)-diNAcBac-PP-undecaprenol alpha-1,4-N-acetyl-D-galactosaminyltransferase
MRIALVISSLGMGGAERVMSLMANYWAAKGWEITIITFDDGGSFYQLDARVNIVGLKVRQDSSNVVIGLWNNLQRIQTLLGEIASLKPELVISFIDQVNVLTILATRSLNLKVIVSERVDPTLHPISPIWDNLRRWTYPFAAKIVVQTPGAVNYFSQQVQLPSHIIPNPVIATTLEAPPIKNHRVILAMGRLTAQKGFDLLLKAFAKIAKQYPDWTLIIIGEGELRPELEALRDKLKLKERVDFPGIIKSPQTAFDKANIFVLSSRFEGFPNALCEAMAHGLAVIATDCPSGPREIIRDGIDGILVQRENVAALSAAMASLMVDEQKRHDLSTCATEIATRFGIEKIMAMWEELLAEVVQEKG